MNLEKGLAVINEENSDCFLESTNRMKSIKENIDRETLQNIETCRALKITLLKDLSEH